MFIANRERGGGHVGERLTRVGVCLNAEQIVRNTRELIEKIERRQGTDVKDWDGWMKADVKEQIELAIRNLEHLRDRC